MTRLEVDTLRAELLERARAPGLIPELATIILHRPFDRTFRFAHRVTSRAMRPPAAQAKLERHLTEMQLRFHELRAEYVTTMSATRIRQLARALPRMERMLAEYATGWIGRGGRAHLNVLCFVPGIDEPSCAYCAALYAENRLDR